MRHPSAADRRVRRCPSPDPQDRPRRPDRDGHRRARRGGRVGRSPRCSAGRESDVTRVAAREGLLERAPSRACRRADVSDPLPSPAQRRPGTWWRRSRRTSTICAWSRAVRRHHPGVRHGPARVRDAAPDIDRWATDPAGGAATSRRSCGRPGPPTVEPPAQGGVDPRVLSLLRRGGADRSGTSRTGWTCPGASSPCPIRSMSPRSTRSWRRRTLPARSARGTGPSWSCCTPPGCA